MLSLENRKLRAQVEALARSERVVLDVLDVSGNVPSNIEVTQPFYICEAPSRQSDAIRISLFASAFEPDLENFVNDVNRTYWLKLQLRNSGNKVARNILIDIDIDGAEKIALLRESMPSGYVSVDIEPQWVTSPNEHVYVDYRRRREGVLVRQRTKYVAVSASESLIPMGLRGSIDSDAQLRFAVKYRAVSEDGESTEGSFTIVVAFIEKRVTCNELKKKYDD